MTLLTPVTMALLSVLGSAPSPVLGADAAPVLLPWVKALKGVEAASVPIDKDRARVELKGGACQLLLTHRSVASCDAPLEIGDTVGCWEGEGCPTERVRTRALAAAGPLVLPWRVPAGDHMAAGGAGADAARKALVAARTKAQERLDVMDPDGARAAVLPLLERSGLGPADLLSVLPMLTRVGAGREAFAVTKRPDWTSMSVRLRVLVHLALTLGPEATVAAAPSALKADMACEVAALGSAFVMTRDFEAAARLMAAVRGVAPSCATAYATELLAWSELDRAEAVLATWEAARGALGDHPALAPLEGIVLDARGETEAFVARLEAKVAGGDHSPGTMKRILAFYVREDFYEAKEAQWSRRAAEAPDDLVAAFFAGVLAHYAKDFAGSNALLGRAAERFSSEPRLHIYLAMNHFNLGDMAASEAAIARAEALEVQDPDVFYCQGEIFRDTDRPRALRALEVYWHQTRLNTDVNSSKQQRVWGLIQALERCVAEPPSGACEGPWEHTFGAGRP